MLIEIHVENNDEPLKNDIHISCTCTMVSEEQFVIFAAQQVSANKVELTWAYTCM